MTIETPDPPVRRGNRLLQASLVAAALGVAPVLTVHGLALGGQPRPHPVRASQHTVALHATPVAAVRQAGPTRSAPGQTDPASSADAAATAPAQKVSATGVSVVGVTWRQGSNVSATDQFQIRTGTAGVWSQWETLDRDASHGPDPSSSEGHRAANGTQPYVVAGADEFEVRALASDSTAPTEAAVEVVDPGTSDADAAPGAPVGGQAAAAAARPTIYSRAQWGADESIRRGGPSYGQTQVAYVHHTDSANNYTASQVPAIIRGIYAYHVESQGWDDIGYNFLVDRFGRIWEGRYGGVDRAVVGAHTLNYNSWSFGVSAIGNFVSATPSQAMLDAIKRIIAWKFTIAGVPATGTVYARDKWFNRISGHRDAFQTSCPGAQLYSRLGEIRTGAASLMGTLPRSAVQRDLDRNGASDLLSYAPPVTSGGTIGPVSALSAASLTPVRAARNIGSGWNVLRNITLTPDLTGDGRADIIAQEPAKNRLRIYPGTGTGGYGTPLYLGSGWNVMNRLIAAGDRTGDGHADLLTTDTSGRLYLYPGTGNGGLGTARVVGSGWAGMSNVLNAGDLTGDGLPDLLAVVTSSGQQKMYAGRADGSVAPGVVWGTGWGFTAVVGGASLDSDGHPDVLARTPAGSMRSYYSGAGGRWVRSAAWGSGWQALSNLSSGADFDGDGHIDLMALQPQVDGGRLLLYSGTGRRDFAVGSNLPLVPGADLARVVGDVDGDGYADVVERVRTNNTLVLLRGQSGGHFFAPRVVGTGWNPFTMLEPAGDLDNDGVPDLLVRTSGGDIRLYPMTRAMGFKPAMVIGSGWNGMLSVVGAGALNSDANDDIVALRWDHALVIYRGSGAGSRLLDVAFIAKSQNDLVQLVAVNDYTGDGRRDILARSSNGALWLYPGDGAGGLAGSRQQILGAQGGANVLG